MVRVRRLLVRCGAVTLALLVCAGSTVLANDELDVGLQALPSFPSMPPAVSLLETTSSAEESETSLPPALASTIATSSASSLIELEPESAPPTSELALAAALPSTVADPFTAALAIEVPDPASFLKDDVFLQELAAERTAHEEAERLEHAADEDEPAFPKMVSAIETVSKDPTSINYQKGGGDIFPSAHYEQTFPRTHETAPHQEVVSRRHRDAHGLRQDDHEAGSPSMMAKFPHHGGHRTVMPHNKGRANAKVNLPVKQSRLLEALQTAGDKFPAPSAGQIRQERAAARMEAQKAARKAREAEQAIEDRRIASLKPYPSDNDATAVPNQRSLVEMDEQAEDSAMAESEAAAEAEEDPAATPAPVDAADPPLDPSLDVMPGSKGWGSLLAGMKQPRMPRKPRRITRIHPWHPTFNGIRPQIFGDKEEAAAKAKADVDRLAQIAKDRQDVLDRHKDARFKRHGNLNTMYGASNGVFDRLRSHPSQRRVHDIGVGSPVTPGAPTPARRIVPARLARLEDERIAQQRRQFASRRMGQRYHAQLHGAKLGVAATPMKPYPEAGDTFLIEEAADGTTVVHDRPPPMRALPPL